MSNLTRKDFLKGALASAAVAAIHTLPARAEEAASYTPGTYTATAPGLLSDVTVTMTFVESSITEVIIDASGETVDIGGAAADTLVEQLLSAQGAEIDGVAGATMTSDAVKKAATSCIAQAKGIDVTPLTEAAPAADSDTPSWAVKPAPIEESAIVETVDTDVLVIGGGYSGCATAASASEQGLSVILVEKGDTLHGNGVGGTGAIASRALDELGITLDKVDAQKRWVKTCGGRCRESLVAKLIENSERCMNWLLDIAEADGESVLVSENHSNDAVHKEDRTYHMLYGGKTAEEYGLATLTPHLLRQFAEAHGATFVYNSPAVQLVQGEDGAVTGAICETEAGYVQYNASKGVVLATGDISFNQEMMNEFCPIGNKVMAKLNGAPGDTGDGHKMALWAGGVFQDGPWPTMMHPQAAAMFHGPFLFVNPEGKRFMNEATWVQGKCVGIMTQGKSDHAYSIFDANWDKYLLESLPTGGGMFWDNFRAVGSTFEDSVATSIQTVEAGLANDPANYFKADTLEELADLIGVPQDTFLATIERYNGLCDEGLDKDFFKDQVFLTPVKEGPFYATKVGVGLLAVVGGVHIDDNNQVLTSEDEPIPGLFAVGNTSGDMYAYDYPINFMGNSHTRCLVGGKVLGEFLATL